MVKEVNNNFGIAAVILGIISISFLAVPIIGSGAGLILGIITLIFAFVQKKKSNNKWAKAGIILGIIGITFNALVTWWVISGISQAMQLYQTCISDPSLPGCEAFLQYAT